MNRCIMPARTPSHNPLPRGDIVASAKHRVTPNLPVRQGGTAQRSQSILVSVSQKAVVYGSLSRRASGSRWLAKKAWSFGGKDEKSRKGEMSKVLDPFRDFVLSIFRNPPFNHWDEPLAVRRTFAVAPESLFDLVLVVVGVGQRVMDVCRLQTRILWHDFSTPMPCR